MGAPPAATSSNTSASAAADLLWLDTLHAIVSRAAHEVKGVLNGVSVNLEVVRSRAEKPETPMSAVTKFANSAADQFDAVIDMTEALLVLARPARASLDVGVTVQRIGALLAPVAKADGRRLVLDGPLSALGTTTAHGNTVRLTIGATLITAIDSSVEVSCRAESGASGPTLRIEALDGSALPAPDPAVRSAALDAGIEIQAELSAISIRFPG